MKKFAFFEKYKKMSVVSKATIWFMVCSLIQKGISFLTTPIFTRMLTKEQYGIYSVYLSWLQIFTIIATFRLDYSVFNKGMSKYSNDRDGYTSSMLGVTTLITTVMLCVYLLFQDQINALTELSTLITLGIFMELYTIPAISFWSLRQRYDFRYVSVVVCTLASAILNALIGVLAVYFAEDKGVARIFSCVLVNVAIGIIIYIQVMRKGKKFFDLKYIKFAILFNIPLILHYFSTYIIEQSDRIMIMKLVNVEAAALYSVAYTVGGIIKIFTAALTNTLIPLQYRLLERLDCRALRRQISSIMAGIVVLITGVAAIGPEVVLILGGEKYLPAVYVMPPVAASVFFSFLYTLLANIEFYFNKNKFAMKISFVGAVVNIVLNLLLIPVCGYVAAAYTTLISYIIYAVGHALYVRRIVQEKGLEEVLDMKLLACLGVGSIALSVFISFFYQMTWVRYGIIAVLIVFVFVNRKEVYQIVKGKTFDKENQ